LIAARRGAWEALGRLKPGLASHTGLPESTEILCGIHDSSANFHRYQAAGLTDFTVVSTGTWVVTLTDRMAADIDEERPGRTCNADVLGRPVPGMLTMAGREFAVIAGEAAGPATAEALARIVASRTFALPSFGADDGLFPGTAGRGRFVGPLAGDPAIRFTLALLYVALLTAECVDGLPRASTVMLDGNFVKDPLYGAMVAALLADRHVRVNRHTYGTASGAALLASHASRAEPASLAIETRDATTLADLTAYRADWRAQIEPRSFPS
jgi:sugar (pentulose or hexulose) kinase